MIREAKPEERPGLVVQLAARVAALGAGMAPSSGPLSPREENREGKERLLKMREVAQVLGVEEEFAREMGRGGDLPVVRLGDRCVRVRLETLRQWIHVRENGQLGNRSP